jgi:hypothetical protein
MHLQAHRLGYHVSVKDSVVQRGAGVIGKTSSVAYIVIGMIMIVGTYQV